MAIAANLTANGNRTYATERVGTDGHDAILMPANVYGWWYDHDLTGAQVIEMLQ